MVQYLRMYGYMTLTVIATVMIVYLIVVVVQAARSRTMIQFKGRALRASIWALAITSLVFSALITVAPILPSAGRMLDLVPLRSTINMLNNITSTTFLQLAGNLLLLGWFSFLLYPLLARPGTLARMLTYSLAISVGVEVMQYILGNGRSSTVDDVIFNVGGAGLCYLLAKRTWVPLLSKICDSDSDVQAQVVSTQL